MKSTTKEIKGKQAYIIGAVSGDVVGSVYEWNNIKTTDFTLFTDKSDFTDDSVLTIAVMDCILNKGNYTDYLQKYGKKYPGRGYGGFFQDWIDDEKAKPYNSFGNGSAMRVSPIGWAFKTIDEVLENARKSAEVTHNHPEGIKGAQAVAAAVFMAKSGKKKNEIKKFIQSQFGYDLGFTLDKLRPEYKFDESCQGSIPIAIAAFLESKDFESAIRLAISMGGDSDTIASIAGAIAEAFYKEIPQNIVENTLKVLPAEIIETLDAFGRKFGIK